MDWNADELKEVKSRLSSLISQHNEELRQIKELESIITLVSSANLTILSRSSSSTKKKRVNSVDDGVDLETQRKSLQARILALETSSGRLLMKIHELQTREKELEQACKGK